MLASSREWQVGPLRSLGLYILDGHEPVACINTHAWGEFMQVNDRRVALTEWKDVRVSTVFLGLDHSFGMGPPILFETMVFGGPFDQERDRYVTWDEAEAGHAAMVKRVKAALGLAA